MADEKTENRHYCPYCEWVQGVLVNETGYTSMLCEHCDMVLYEDVYDFKSIENEESDRRE
jgi:transcription initiation factor TFIIIB Brf1 subunit/transcription initiation factor TFIIB